MIFLFELKEHTLQKYGLKLKEMLLKSLKNVTEIVCKKYIQQYSIKFIPKAFIDCLFGLFNLHRHLQGFSDKLPSRPC